MENANSKKVFVFVVCGAAEHIDTLHFSLKALRKFSVNEIWVLTDSSRNEKPIESEHLVNQQTPAHLNHHQASIYLKTGIHRFLPKGNTYCYLDTDVVALSSACDEVFRQRSGVINFAQDHCRVRSFSPHAVNCTCQQQWSVWHNELEGLLDKYDYSRHITDPAMLDKRKKLFRKFDLIKQKPLQYGLISARFLFSPVRFKLDEDTYYHRWKRHWHDAEGRVMLYANENLFKLVEKHSRFVWNRWKQRWFAEGKYDVYHMECNHLIEQINSTFGITVKEENWQHWNGGVFLFDDESHAFLDAWHQKTMHIFTLPEWKTRDQGTLIATAWEFGLQEQLLLSKRFNFIADYNSHHIALDETKTHLTDDSFKTLHDPALIHVYHNFGLKGWDVWDWIEQKVNTP
jgi:hypothetical protein